MNRIKTILAFVRYIALIIIAIIECIAIVILVDCQSTTDYLVIAFILCVSVGFIVYTLYEIKCRVVLEHEKISVDEINIVNKERMNK